MPYKLRITNEEVENELKKLGLTDLTEEMIEEFRKDLLKLIKNDLRMLKKMKKEKELKLQSEEERFKREIKFSTTSTPSSFLEQELEKEKKMKVLVVGDSEAAAFEQAAQEVYEKFGLKLVVRYEPGRSLLYSEDDIMTTLDSTFDVVLILGLTSFSWRKVPLTPSNPEVTLITDNPDVHYSQVKNFMQRITLYCKGVNPNILVYLVIPTVKDIYQFNRKLLARAELLEVYETLMDSTDIFKQHYLQKKAIKIYNKQCKLGSDPLYKWKNRNFMSAQHAVNKYYMYVKGMNSKVMPHVRYLRKKVSVLEVTDFIYDGLHYTPRCIKFLFFAHQQSCPWIKEVGTGPSSSSRADSSPIDSTTPLSGTEEPESSTLDEMEQRNRTRSCNSTSSESDVGTRGTSGGGESSTVPPPSEITEDVGNVPLTAMEKGEIQKLLLKIPSSIFRGNTWREKKCSIIKEMQSMINEFADVL